MIDERTIKQKLVQFTGNVSFKKSDSGCYNLFFEILNNDESSFHLLLTQRKAPRCFSSKGKALDYLDRIGFIKQNGFIRLIEEGG